MQAHSRKEKLEALGRVIDTLDVLRVECPWDRKQTFESLCPNTIEEVYELCDALLNENNADIKKELGDVLLHVLFYSKIGEEKGMFDICDVADALNEKLLYRHPHIFGNVSVNDAHDVEQNWEQLKLKEKGGNKSVLSGVPKALPALVKSYRVQEKAANYGFDWEEKNDVWNKVQEEISELNYEMESEDKARMEAEFGDVLFSLVNVGRLYGINPENALERTNLKFISRFNYVEEKAKNEGLNLKDMTLAQMDVWWNEAKSRE